MKQSSFRYLGLFDLVVVAAFTAFFGFRAFTELFAIPAMAVAGVSALLAGYVSRISLGPVTLTWRHLVAVTYILFAVILPGNVAPTILAGTAEPVDWFLFVAGSLGALSLLFYGIDIARDGGNFDVEENVDRVVGW